MSIFKFIIPGIAIASLTLFSWKTMNGEKLKLPGIEDSLARRTDNYIRYINAIGAHGAQYMKTYAQIAGKKKFLQVLNTNNWPDSVTQTVNVIYYNNEVAEYAETPAVTTDGNNIEYDNYFYNGKLLAYRYFEVINNSYCTGSTLTNTVIVYYDSTGKCIKTTHTLFDSNNKAIDPEICLSAKTDLTHIYNTYLETPMAKEGIEGKGK